MTDPFAGIIGQARAVSVLRRALAAGRLPHAVLFVGPAGVGRRTLAEALLEAFFGTRPDQHPDFIRVGVLSDEKTGKEKSGVSVDQVRELVERFSRSSFTGRKAVFVEEAERLTHQAANALLKTLEEPKGDALLVLRAPSVESVPATVVSRCQVIRLHPCPRAELAATLGVRGLAPDDAHQLAALARGRPGRALALLRDGAARAAADVGFSGFVQAFTADPPARSARASALIPKEEVNRAAAFADTLDAWEDGLRDALLASVGCTDLASRPFDELRALPAADWPARLRALADVRKDTAHHVNPQLALEHILFA